MYTGTFGTLQYQNRLKTVDYGIFLYEQDGNKWILAPLYFWKVIHNPTENEAVAFIGINDPHETIPPVSFCEVGMERYFWG